MIITANAKIAGDPACFRERLYEIIAEFPEMTWGSTKEVAYTRLCEATESLDERIEITVRSPEGILMGFAVLAHDDDDHVGECIGTQWHWVSPEARGPVGRMILRQIFKLARALEYRVVAYTKRIGVGRYEINYKQLKENTNGQED